jgi:hypothetical protein
MRAVSVIRMIRLIRVIRVIRVISLIRGAAVCCLLPCYFAHSVTEIPFTQIAARAANPHWVTGCELLWHSRPARTTCSAPAFPARILISAAKQHRCQQ